jgi:hypothetical protein
MHCKDSPAYILDQPMCLTELSKETDLERPGELRLLLADEEVCDDGCRTLKTIHQLDLPLRRGECDRAGPLDGRLHVCDLTHALAGGDFFGRGFHAGSFSWAGQQGLLASGTVSGVSNAGTHRKPFDPACQECNAPGFMEGRLCGVVRRAPAQPALLGCQVFGAYRLRFDGSLREQRTPVRGVLEGLVVCECQPAQRG